MAHISIYNKKKACTYFARHRGLPHPVINASKHTQCVALHPLMTDCPFSSVVVSMAWAMFGKYKQTVLKFKEVKHN